MTDDITTSIDQHEMFEDVPPGLICTMAAAVMGLPWTHGDSEEAHVHRYGEIQEALAAALNEPLDLNVLSKSLLEVGEFLEMQYPERFTTHLRSAAIMLQSQQEKLEDLQSRPNESELSPEIEHLRARVRVLEESERSARADLAVVSDQIDTLATGLGKLPKLMLVHMIMEGLG